MSKTREPEAVGLSAPTESLGLWGKGIGYVDTHLLASLRLAGDARLWTLDKRLHAQAERLGVAYAA